MGFERKRLTESFFFKKLAGDVISAVIGWTYFAAWSISFYPQGDHILVDTNSFFLDWIFHLDKNFKKISPKVIVNWRRKSVVGLSFDYVTYNIIGFSCYTAYNSAFYFSTFIQEQYEQQNNGRKNMVQLNDVFFGIHAIVLTLIIIVQIIIYEKGDQANVSILTN